jgi:hypothetical protein
MKSFRTTKNYTKYSFRKQNLLVHSLFHKIEIELKSIFLRYRTLIRIRTTVVELLATNPEIEGLHTVTSQHHEEWQRKIIVFNTMKC